MTLQWTRRALRRLDGIGAYVAEHDPHAASRLVGRIAEQTDQLRTYPMRGRQGRAPGTRELVVSGTPYIVAYRIVGDDIEVITVLHAAQAWPRLL